MPRRRIDATAPLGQPPRSRLSSLLRAPLARRRIRGRGRFAEMRRLARSVDARLPAETGPRVLVVQLKEGAVLAGYSAVFAQALRLRGATVAVLTCGGGQPITEVGWGRRAAPFPCNRCGYFTDRWAAAQGVEHFRLRDTMPWGRDPAAAPAALPDEPHEIDVAEATKISVPRWFRAEHWQRFANAEAVATDFAVAAHGVQRAVAPILDRFAPDVVLVHNGSVTSEHVVKVMAERRGARVVTYIDGVPPGSLMLTEGDSAVHQDWSAAWALARDEPLTAEQSAAIRAYMHGRAASGSGAPLDDLGLDAYDRVATLFTNVAWDSACLDRNVGFSSMRDWVVAAIAAARDTPRTALVVRIHPDEVTWGTFEPVVESIAEAFPQLPPNVRVVAPGQRVDSYALMERSDLVITYTSTTGIEAAVRGTPVALCGAGHYRGKGFALEVTGPGELARLLAPGTPLPEPDRELAWRYAFTFFFRLCVPFPAVDAPSLETLDSFPVDAGGLEPGGDPYLDFVCDRILRGGEFLLPGELATAAAEATQATRATTP